MSILTTAHGVPHVSAPDFESLAYGVAHAHARDNVCQTAQQLVTARGERARFFGGTASALLGRRVLPNELIDLFIAAHMDDAATAGKARDALAQAVRQVRAAGFALDATLRSMQRPLHTEEPIALHGGDEVEGVLNSLGNQFAPGITARGLRIDYGSSYIQTVGFDARGPVGQAILSYSQSTDPASPHLADPTRLFSRKQWSTLPFPADEVAQARIGEVLRLTLP